MIAEALSASPATTASSQGNVIVGLLVSFVAAAFGQGDRAITVGFVVPEPVACADEQFVVGGRVERGVEPAMRDQVDIIGARGKRGHRHRSRADRLDVAAGATLGGQPDGERVERSAHLEQVANLTLRTAC